MHWGRAALSLIAATLLWSVAANAEEREKVTDGSTEMGAQGSGTEEQPMGGREQAKPTGKGTARLEELVVEAKKPLSSASSDEVREKDYAVRPHDTMMEILNNIPGLVVAQHQGGGKTPQWLIRGFDADHGTDFAVYVDNLPVNLTLLMNGGVTTDFGNGFSAALRLRYLGDRPANADRTLTARGYALLDLLGRYRWRNVEVQLSLLNLTDTDWREAQFDDQSCVRGEVGGGDCALSSPGKQGGPQSNAGVDGIHLTPGNPFWVRGGVAVYF